jgi:hypothetical protein
MLLVVAVNALMFHALPRGWTLNMGNRWSWLILGAAVLAIVMSNLMR